MNSFVISCNGSFAYLIPDSIVNVLYYTEYGFLTTFVGRYSEDSKQTILAASLVIDEEN